MAINLIDIGATANDGSGDPIRTAFQTVNNNFDYINGGLFAGSEASTISAVSVTGGVIVSNTSLTADSTTSNNLTVTGALGGNLYVQSNGAYIVGNVTILGNLTVSGAQAASQSQQTGTPILSIHYSATPLILDDGKDIGLEWQYYDGIEKRGFLGWQNTTGSLVYLDDITDTSNVITAGTFGNVQFGQLLLSNTTTTTSNTTGALRVAGGISTLGNLYVAGNVVSTFANVGNLAVQGYHVGNMYFAGLDTIYINGSPVQTAATAFNGGTVGLATIFNDGTQSTSVSTGAVRIPTGGLGVAGNIWAANIHVQTGGNIRSNVQGNIFTPAQPFITSLGTLTTLNINGQLNVNDISPNSNQLYSLGTATNDRWLKLWTYDADISGALVTSGNTQATSTTSGDVRVRGGLSIETGNIHIGGSAGRSITATGNIIVDGSVLPTNGNLTHSLGSSTDWWNNVFAETFRGTSVTANYADLAEIYKSDQAYEYGTVVVFGGEFEITTTNELADHRVAGVISQNPAYLMNNTAEGLPVALRGRVPVRVTGPVAKGDLLVTSTTPGYARSVGSDTGYGVRIFAKALESNSSNRTKIIEAVIL